ncbi:reverse transcriptase domain-containing protein [Tanacetum coccineum]
MAPVTKIQFHQTPGLGSLPNNTIANPKGDVKAITTRSGVSYNGPQTSSLLKRWKMNPSFKIYGDFSESPFRAKFRGRSPTHAQICTNVCNALNDKDKMIELTKTPVNENCSAVILKKFPEKLGDPGRFLIPCDFPEMNECLALADLGASINLMPLSIWKELSLPALTKTRMILELADRTISTPTGIAEDVFVKVGTFFFPADFVVVDYVADPRVPLILGRPFLRMARALIDVHGEQMTLRQRYKSVTFIVGDTKTFSYNIINRLTESMLLTLLDEEYVQEVLEISESGNPTSTSDLMIDSRLHHFIPSKGDTSTVLAPIRFLEEENDQTVVQHREGFNPNSHEMLERLAGNEYYCFLDGFSGYFQIPIDPLDQEKTTFTCPYGTFAYRRMPFGLCNAPGTFQRCMVAIFHDMIEKTMEVFMDDFSVFGDSFSSCLSHLDKCPKCVKTSICAKLGKMPLFWSRKE